MKICLAQLLKAVDPPKRIPLVWPSVAGFSALSERVLWKTLTFVWNLWVILDADVYNVTLWVLTEDKDQ